jgi:hypothetical protein
MEHLFQWVTDKALDFLIGSRRFSQGFQRVIGCDYHPAGGIDECTIKIEEEVSNVVNFQNLMNFLA